MTHNLTQNRKIADGISGANRMEKDMFSDIIRPESTENICSPPLSAAHNPEVAGSSPAAATKTPEIARATPHKDNNKNTVQSTAKVRQS